MRNFRNKRILNFGLGTLWRVLQDATHILAIAKFVSYFRNYFTKYQFSYTSTFVSSRIFLRKGHLSRDMVARWLLRSAGALTWFHFGDSSLRLFF